MNDKISDIVIWLIVGGLVGALGTIAIFRASISIMRRDIEVHAASILKISDTLVALEKRLERRQLVTLQMLAAMAQKLNVENRFDDVILRFLSEDTK